MPDEVSGFKRPGRKAVDPSLKRILISSRVLPATLPGLDKIRAMIPPDTNQSYNASDGMASYGHAIDFLTAEYLAAMTEAKPKKRRAQA